MELTLNRSTFDSKSTEGKMSVDGAFRCFTLELPNVDGKPGSCIPQGRYPVVLAPSPKFLSSTDSWVQRFASRMPHLQSIPGRSLIMIHWGNDPTNTEGCILVGQTPGTDFIGGSRAAFENLYNEIQGPAISGQCFITVVGGATVSGS